MPAYRAHHQAQLQLDVGLRYITRYPRLDWWPVIIKWVRRLEEGNVRQPPEMAATTMAKLYWRVDIHPRSEYHSDGPIGKESKQAVLLNVSNLEWSDRPQKHLLSI